MQPVLVLQYPLYLYTTFVINVAPVMKRRPANAILISLLFHIKYKPFNSFSLATRFVVDTHAHTRTHTHTHAHTHTHTNHSSPWARNQKCLNHLYCRSSFRYMPSSCNHYEYLVNNFGNTLYGFIILMTWGLGNTHTP